MLTVQSLLGPIRAQKGCVGSHLYLEIGDEEALCLMVEWATQEDLYDHLQSNYFVVLLGAARLLKRPAELEFKLLTQTAGIEAVEAINGKINA